MSIFQSTLPARGATSPACLRSTKRRISIHAPRTGSDHLGHISVRSSSNFNPRSPHGERRYHSTLRASPIYFNPRSPHGERQPHIFWRFAHLVFQSTLPARGATRRVQRLPCRQRDFNPRSPHGERPPRRGRTRRRNGISIHAPRTGSDGKRRNHSWDFGISIHAPRTGSD